jgi:murein DD-endopeptidase MepM/ murein hydrolase activator NlpD
MDIITKHLCNAIKNKHCWLTFCSTFIVTILAIVFLTNQTDVNASAYPEKMIDEITAAEVEFFETPMLTNMEENDDSSESAHQIVEEISEEVVELKQGDTLLKILTNLGMEYQEANNVYMAAKKVYDPRKLRVGQKLQIKYRRSNAENKLLSVENIISTIRTGERIFIERDENGKYCVQIQKDELIEEINSVAGVIENNLSISMNKQNIPANIAANFINIFSYSIDFRRDIKNGDNFEIIYKSYITPNGEVVQNGNIIYASLTLKKDKIDLYRFKDTAGNVDYYDENGLALKKILSRKPMSFQKAHISSPFGKRRHPIYNDIRIHWGIDYAAPKNSLIYAAGDGVVLAAKYNGGYGNYIKIRHNSEYSTAYGHMQKFAKGIKPGKRVKQGQVIGYVGSTGRSTGPHLHYEIIRNGKRVNPLTVKASASENLKGKNLINFKRVVANIKSTHQKIFADKKLKTKKQVASIETKKSNKQN